MRTKYRRFQLFTNAPSFTSHPLFATSCFSVGEEDDVIEEESEGDRVIGLPSESVERFEDESLLGESFEKTLEKMLILLGDPIECFASDDGTVLGSDREID